MVVAAGVRGESMSTPAPPMMLTMASDPSDFLNEDGVGMFGLLTPAGWLSVSLFVIVWMFWGFELLWTACVEGKTWSYDTIAHVVGGLVMIKALGAIFGSFAQLTAMWFFFSLSGVDCLFFFMWEFTRRLRKGGQSDVLSVDSAFLAKGIFYEGEAQNYISQV